MGMGHFGFDVRIHIVRREGTSGWGLPWIWGMGSLLTCRFRGKTNGYKRSDCQNGLWPGKAAVRVDYYLPFPLVIVLLWICGRLFRVLRAIQVMQNSVKRVSEMGGSTGGRSSCECLCHVGQKRRVFGWVCASVRYEFLLKFTYSGVVGGERHD